MALGLENRIPPPVVALATAGLMYAAAWLVPAADAAIPGRRVVALGFAAVGVMLDLIGVVHFLRAKTTVSPLKPGAASALVTAGVYRFTRNPMYVGMAILLAAWGVYLANVAALASVALFVLYIDLFQIAPEERALRARFGEEFEAYCRRVRRWL
jgi:protein-S-isoprenylcysteine O-methyltransferase Ste14